MSHFPLGRRDFHLGLGCQLFLYLSGGGLLRSAETPDRPKIGPEAQIANAQLIKDLLELQGLFVLMLHKRG